MSDTWQVAVSLAIACALPSSSEISTLACLATCTSSGRAMRVSSRSSRSHSSSVCVLPSCVTRGARHRAWWPSAPHRWRVPDCDARCRAHRRACTDCRGPGTRVPRAALRAARRGPRCAGWRALRRWRDCARVSSATARRWPPARATPAATRRRRRQLVLDLAHARERVVGPGLRELFEVDVAIDARQQPLGAELGQALIDHAAGFAELRDSWCRRAPAPSTAAPGNCGARLVPRNSYSPRASSGGSPSPCVLMTTYSSFSLAISRGW